MAKAKLSNEWKKELTRVKRLIAKAKKQGVHFEFDPTPKTPKRITQKSLQRIKSIDLKDIKLKGTTIEEIESKHRTESKSVERKAKTPSLNTDIKKPRQAPLVTEEEAKRRAKKAQETRKKREERNPKLAEKRKKQRAEQFRKNLEKKKQRELSDPKYAEEQARLRKERAKKAAETRKKNEELNKELAEQRKKQRAEQFKKNLESKKQKELSDPKYAEEQARKRSEAAKKAAETRKLNKQNKEQIETDEDIIEEQEIEPSESQETDDHLKDIVTEVIKKVGDPITKTMVEALETKEEQEQDQEQEPQINEIDVIDFIEEPSTPDTDEEETTDEQIENIDPLTGEVNPKPEKQKSYQELLDMRRQEREDISNLPYSEFDNILDTIRTELTHAVNEEISLYLNSILDDLISYHEFVGDSVDWLQDIKDAGSELLSNVYRLVDESDGEKVRASVLSFLLIMYGSYGSIPDSVLERTEMLTSEYYFHPSQVWKTQRRIIRRSKLSARYS